MAVGWGERGKGRRRESGGRRGECMVLENVRRRVGGIGGEELKVAEEAFGPFAGGAGGGGGESGGFSWRSK